jgi:hypothetical protein
MAVTIKFKAIVPPKINPDLYKLQMLKALDREIQIDKRMMEKTVTTWSHPRPVFRTESKVSDMAMARAWTDSDKWNWTDQGTEPHYIVARRSKYLKFTVGGKPKTRVRTLGSGRGARGRRWVQKQVVKHPGTKARLWSQEVVKRRRSLFLRDMQAANVKGTDRASRGR